MAYTTIDDPTAHFNISLYTASGAARSVIGTGFQPDCVWVKSRNNATNHNMYDSSRGETARIYPNLSDVEDTVASFTLDSDGFSFGASNGIGDINIVNKTYVAWQWKANGGTRTTNTESGANPGGGYQVNTTAGFSIIDYTGTGSAGTMAHGLGAVPELMLVKGRDIAGNWRMYHHKLASDPETDAIKLDETAVTLDSDGFWNDTAPTSSVFTLGDNDNTNEDGNTYIAYLWKEIQGYSKFGKYTGNGNVDGPFVYTGFRPAWIMEKRSDNASSTHWKINDIARDANETYGNDASIHANETAVESASGSFNVDFLSNGFKLRSSDAANNADGGTHIYMAFAAAPFVTSNGAPTNAQ